MKNLEYKKTVDLLLDILPFALEDERVALKGGTAINLFHRDFPRFSVDIDLCYLPLESRDATYKNLHEILQNIKNHLENKLKLKVNTSSPLNGKKEAKLIAIKDGVEVKIEPNFILRSSLFDTQDIELSKKAQKEFEKSVTVRCLNIADTFGGKICAALDRQHPRDLFDVKNLFDNEGITADVKDSFIFYLISHNRPINELLNPNFKDIENEYKNEFVSMAKVDVPLDELLKVRLRLVQGIKSALTENDKSFLISFVSNIPDWSLVRDDKIKDFPSVKWKMFNQEKLEVKDKVKHKNYVDSLKNLLKS